MQFILINDIEEINTIFLSLVDQKRGLITPTIDLTGNKLPTLNLPTMMTYPSLTFSIEGNTLYWGWKCNKKSATCSKKGWYSRGTSLLNS